jgi:hypothetical protein
MQISYSIDIKSKPNIVFGWLETPEKAMEWMTSVSKTEILHETPNRVGTTFRETVEEDGNGIEMQGVITGYERNKSISFHLNSRVNIVDVEYRIEEIPDGVCLKENAHVRWKFPINLISIFGGAKMKQSLITQLQVEFNRLKELCESAAPNMNDT